MNNTMYSVNYVSYAGDDCFEAYAISGGIVGLAKTMKDAKTLINNTENGSELSLEYWKINSKRTVCSVSDDGEEVGFYVIEKWDVA